MSFSKGIVRFAIGQGTRGSPAGRPRFRGKKKRGILRRRAYFDHAGQPFNTAYFGAPCTASVTTARVNDGASISRKV